MSFRRILGEGVFGTIKDAEIWFSALESRFPGLARQSHFIVDDVVREGFLSDPDLV